MHTTLTTDQTAIIDNHAALAAYALHHGAPAYACDVQPGNGTRYVMVLAAMTHARGNPKCVEGDHLLSLPYFQTAYPTNLGGYTTPDYAAEKWTRGNLADGEVIAAYLNAVARFLKAAAENLDD
jgi:hypothetical protein